MPKTWFVGAGRAGLPPAQTGDRLIPLSAMAQSLIPGGGGSPVEIAALETQAQSRVFADLAAFAAAIQTRAPTRRWFRYGEYDLSPVFRRPDEAMAGFPNQATAFEVGSAASWTGPLEAWGADSFQVSGLRAALGGVVTVAPKNDRTPTAAALPRGLFRRRPSAGARPCDILYLSLEPHVALQQDRVLSLLSDRYGIVAVGLQRTSWPWPEEMRFTPREHPPLISYLRPTDLVRAVGSWAMRPNPGPTYVEYVRWMSARERDQWLRTTWLRAASVSDALARAIETHRPRLIIGTNLASGMGTVIASCAAHHGVAVMSLPTGADCLVPPQFDPGDAGETRFVVPGGIAERLRQAGVQSEQLLACGWPELDAIVDAGNADLGSFRRQLGLDSKKPLVVFFSSPSTANDELVVPAQVKERALRRLAESCLLEGFQLAVKLHPRETDGVMERVAGEISPQPLVFRESLSILLHLADVVATVGSAVSFAGVALGKPTVILEADSIRSTAALFASVSVGSQPRSLEELTAFLRSAANRSIDVGDSRDLWGADGKVAERIRAEVDRMLS